MILTEDPISYTAYIAAKQLVANYEAQQAKGTLPPEFVTLGNNKSVLRLELVGDTDYRYYKDKGAWDIDFVYSRMQKCYITISSDVALRGLKISPTTYEHWLADNDTQDSWINADEIPF